MATNHLDSESNLENGDSMSDTSRGRELAAQLAASHDTGVDVYDSDLYQPIPLDLPPVAGWKELPLTESGEPMVPLGPFSSHRDVFTSSIYYGEHGNSPYIRTENKLDGSLITMFAREAVATVLTHAQQLLPQAHRLIVLDSYRSLDVQQALYDHYYGALARLHDDWSSDELSAETQKYVSIPSTDESRPSPHNTGGSVDLAIFTLPSEIDARIVAIDLRLDEIDDQDDDDAYLLEMEKIGLIRRYADFLDFGTQFDHGGREAASNYFEVLGAQRALTDAEVLARDNRRLLYNVMTQVGMQPYEDEWWHFNSPQSQMGAQSAGLDRATYGGVELDSANTAHEQMRRMHRAGLIRMQEASMVQPGLQPHHFAGKVGMDPRHEALIDLNLKALSETGDPRLTSLPPAVIIEPTEESVA